jgi:putative transposase
MPRKPRMYLPYIPTHVVHRGNNRLPSFFTDKDYWYYLQCLNDARQKYTVDVHAYCLMTNHVHLLLTPTTKEGISKVMQSIGRRYVQYINKCYRRTGTLWESRHKSSLVQEELYLFTCYKYIELNPVRAKMVRHPGDYPWSSYRYHALGEANELITTHYLYDRLGSEDEDRHMSYRALFARDMEKTALHAIHNAVNFSLPLGNKKFHKEIKMIIKKESGSN